MNKVIVCIMLLAGLGIPVLAQQQQVENQTLMSVGLDSLVNGITAVNEVFEYDENKMYEIPNTNIKIQPPDYFKFTESVSGFVHVGTMSSIQVEEVVGTSYLMIAMAMDSAYFASQGMKLISSEPVVMHDGSDGVLFTTEMKIKGFVFERLILMSGDYHYTMWINASYIKLLSSKVKDIILQSILTSKIYE